MPKSIRRLLAVAALASLAIAPLAAVAHADDSVPPTAEGPKTVVKYVTCAGTLGLAPNVSIAFAAFMLCVKMFVDEVWPSPAP